MINEEDQEEIERGLEAVELTIERSMFLSISDKIKESIKLDSDEIQIVQNNEDELKDYFDNNNVHLMEQYTQEIN